MVSPVICPSSGDPARKHRWWARSALLALASLAAAVVALVLARGDAFLMMLGALGATFAVAAAASWWALTTRKAWKRGVSLGLIAGLATLALGLVLGLVGAGLAEIGAILAIVLAGAAYMAATHRALAGRVVDQGEQADLYTAPSERPWLLVNPRSGDGTAGRVGLVDAAAAAGVQVHVLAQGEDAAELARQAVTAGADAIGAAGGDGTLGLVAAVGVERDVPFVCVPTGTRNHFARDLGLDRKDPLAALAAFEGRERQVDVGFVGSRLFLNNVSLGAYAEVVAEPGYRAHKLGTARRTLRRLVRGEKPPLDVVFDDPDGRRYENVQLLQVSNNAYRLRRLARLGARERLDGGVLQVSLLQPRNGVALAGAVGSAVVGRTAQGNGWAQWSGTTLRVDSPLPSLWAGIDGEAVRLAPPLSFTIRSGALRVLVPSITIAPAGASSLSRRIVSDLWTIGRPGSVLSP